MVTCHDSDLLSALADELDSQRDWYPRLVDFGAPAWKLERVEKEINRLANRISQEAERSWPIALSIYDELSQADELAELESGEIAEIMAADHAGLWDV